MMDDVQEAVEEAGLAVGLQALRNAEAPRGLLPSVMVRVGLGDSYFPIETPIGPVFVTYNDRGISSVIVARDAVELQRIFKERFDRKAYLAAEPSPSFRRTVIDGLQGRGGRHLRFDLRALSEFERAVLHKALEIPHGQVRPYAWIAREIGRPKAVRAVGSALAHNPVPMLIPCHRVVRSDGVLGEYGLGGPDNKRIMLEAEGTKLAEIEALARRGIRYLGSETTKIYCFPTCHHARRITPRHQHPFHSESEAAKAGFRPCKACRPASVALGTWNVATD